MKTGIGRASFFILTMIYSIFEQNCGLAGFFPTIITCFKEPSTVLCALFLLWLLYKRDKLFFIHFFNSRKELVC